MRRVRPAIFECAGTPSRHVRALEEVAPSAGPPYAAHPRISWAQTCGRALLLVVATRVLLMGAAYAGAWFLASTNGPAGPGATALWSHWDASIFLRIAHYGYTDPLTDPHAAAFFPLFPLLIRWVAAIGVAPVLAGLIISGAASVIAATYLLRLVQEEQGREAGLSAVLYLLVFPTAVFLVAPYSEALFLAGAIPAFYYARRSEWGRVALPAAVAMGARFAGIFLLLGLAAQFVSQRNFGNRRTRAAAGALAAGATPLVAYALYLWHVTGEPLRFAVDQRLGWGRTFVGPVDSFLNTFNTYSGVDYPTNWIFAWRLEIVAAALGVGFVVWAIKRREWGYTVYMGSLLAALMTSTWYYSIPRMLLTLWPITVLLAGFTTGHRLRHELVLLGLATCSVLGAVVFTQGAWFF